MTLWPGYWKGKTPLEPILKEIPKRNIYELVKNKPSLKIKTVGGNLYTYNPEVQMRYANGTVAMEDFGAGETVFWAFPLDNEIHLILKGNAKLTYSLEGTNHTEEKTIDIVEGDVYIIPRGARMTWKVDESGPLVHLCFIIPGLVVPERNSDAVEKLN